MNSFKLLIFLLLVNYMLSVSITAHEQLDTNTWLNDETTTVGLTQLRNEIDQENTQWGNVKGDNSGVQETSYGNTIKLGSLLWKSFLNLFDPLPVDVYDDNNSLQAIASAINFLLIALKSMVILNLYMLLKNKKTN